MEGGGTFGFQKRIALEGGVAATVTLRAQRLKKFKILIFSSEIENFKRAAH